MMMMSENKFEDEMLKQAAEEYSNLLKMTAMEMEMEAEALEVEIPDRLTGRLSRKYRLKLNKSEQHEKRVTNLGLAFVAILLICIWFPQTVTAVVNVFRELVFVDNGRSMEVQSGTRADSSFDIEMPEGFVSEGTFLIGRNAVRTRYQSTEEYIEITEYSEGYKLSYDSEELDSNKNITIQSYPGKIFRKNGITTIVLDYSGIILEIESSLPEDDLAEIAKSMKEKEETK